MVIRRTEQENGAGERSRATEGMCYAAMRRLVCTCGGNTIAFIGTTLVRAQFNANAEPVRAQFKLNVSDAGAQFE